MLNALLSALLNALLSARLSRRAEHPAEQPRAPASSFGPVQPADRHHYAAASSITRSAIERLAVSPGDSMPKSWITPGTPCIPGPLI